MSNTNNNDRNTSNNSPSGVNVRGVALSARALAAGGRPIRPRPTDAPTTFYRPPQATSSLSAPAAPPSAAATSTAASSESAATSNVSQNPAAAAAAAGSSSSSTAAAFTAGGAAVSSKPWLVVGDNVIGPYMALSLRANGVQCDLAQHASTNDCDRNTVVLTPSVTQQMGDTLNVAVPSGSVVGRVLTFDHVGNDMCDTDLNEFREQGDAPTFFVCERPKIEQALMALCRNGPHACGVVPQPAIARNGVVPLERGGVRVTFTNGLAQEYAGIIATARNQALVPEVATQLLVGDAAELRRREENATAYRAAADDAFRWLEVCVPPLPELAKFEKRFTPGSQEIVELITPRATKMIVRPTMLATKLFYNVAMTIPEHASDPRKKNVSMKQFWDDVVDHWTGGIPGYVTHTMFRPMFQHVQTHFAKHNALLMRTPSFVLPHWHEAEGRIIKIGPSVHQTNLDAIDVGDAQAFKDCFYLAQAIAGGEAAVKAVEARKAAVEEEMILHRKLTSYALTERGQFKYAISRFNMKLLRKYKRSWRGILTNYVTMVPKIAP